MTYGEFKEELKGSRIKKDAEMVIHTESGDYEISQLEFSKSENRLKVCTMDETRKSTYRMTYRITKDHQLYAVDTVRVSASSDDDVILGIGDWVEKFKKQSGFDKGEVSEKSGSTVIVSKEVKPVVDKDGKVEMKEVDVKHYFNLDMLEIFRELDEENDVYIRIWKNGEIG